MSSALPIDAIIDIVSVGAKDTFSIGKLNTIVIEPYDDALPQKKFLRTFDLQTTNKIFGANSNLAKFAGMYFGFSSKNATKADMLHIYTWNKEAKPALIKGGKAPSLSDIKLLNGNFKITIGKNSADVNVNLTKATSFADVATKLQTAITSVSSQSSNIAFTSAKVTYSSITMGFIVKSGQAGQGETIDFLSTPDSGIDIHSKLGLTLDEGAELITGEAAVNDFASVLNEINVNNGNYYLITPNFEFETSELEANLKAFGTFLKNSNSRYAGLYSWSNKALLTIDSGVTKPYEAYDGLIIDFKTKDYQNGLVAALISAMDLSKANGNYNIAFNDTTEFQLNAIVEKLHYEGLKSNKANAPCKFGVLGQDDTIYMDGTILGGLTDNINVYICNSFLKFNLQISLYNMFKAQALIGLRDKNSQAIVLSYLNDVFSKAVNANIIAVGAKLTNTEEQVVISNFSKLVDNVDKVINQLENIGYFYTIKDINTQKRELTIINAYVANTPVKKIIINNYILGA
ncbi:DUF3383 family protein [Campylobacter sp.]|uniref:DUF3383 family protein n=1 Tax=Campylobacter sp. TaxID=205 RepID=UPI0025BC0743|nr:DUF3383 family protein [Campylobacter sp.]